MSRAEFDKTQDRKQKTARRTKALCWSGNAPNPFCNNIATSQCLLPWLVAIIAVPVLSHDELTRVVITLCAIWNAPRKVIHENEFQRLMSHTSARSSITLLLYLLELLGLAHIFF
jgi:hypothetical protein